MREFPASPAVASALALHAAAQSPVEQNAQLSISFGETVPIDALREAWQKVAALHPVLRTSFQKSEKTGAVRQEFDAAEAPWRVLDWTGIPVEDMPARWSALLQEDAAAPFDLSKPPLLRFTALELPGGHHHILATFPAFLLDEDALFPILRDWLDTPELPTPSEDNFPGEAADAGAAREWWKAYLGDSSRPLSPACHLKEGQSAWGEEKLLVDREDSERLRQFCRDRDLPLRDVVLSAWALVLGRLTRRDDVRLLAAPGESGNLLPAAISLDHDSAAGGWLATIARSEAERERQAVVSLGEALSLASPRGGIAEWPVAFAFRRPSLNERIHTALPRWINFDAKLQERSPFPLFLEARDGDRLTLRLEFSHRPPSEAHALLERVARVLEAWTADPHVRLGNISLLSSQESEVAASCNRGPELRTPQLRIEEDIKDNAALTPEAVAVEGPGEEILSYAELTSRAGSLAAHLHQMDLGEGWNIGICLAPSSWVPVALLGILQAGDTCVPLDPSASAEWITRQLEQYDVEMVLCDARTAPLFESQGRRHFALDENWSQVASSSSSVFSPPPKTAVLLAGTENIPRAELYALGPELLSQACMQGTHVLNLQAGNRVPLLSPAGTGSHIDQILTVFAAGATVVIPDSNPEPAARPPVTHWHHKRGQNPPEEISTLVIEANSAPFPAINADENFPFRLIHYYSPAGLSGLSVSCAFNGAESIPEKPPVGAPVAGMEIRLVDNAGQRQPPGYAGQLQFILPAHAISSLDAWQDHDGMLHLLFPPPKSEEPPLPSETPLPQTDDGKIEPAEMFASPAPWRPLTLLQQTIDSPVLYLVHDLDGNPERYRALANQFAGEWTLYATASRDFQGSAPGHATLAREAAAVIEAIVAENPNGPYNLLGFGYGAVLAFEIARQLTTKKASVDFLALVGSRPPRLKSGESFLRSLSQNLTDAVRGRLPGGAAAPPAAAAHLRLLRDYRAVPLDVPACVILGSDLGRDTENGWLACAPEAFIERLDYDSKDLLLEPAVKRLALLLRECTEDSAEAEE